METKLTLLVLSTAMAGAPACGALAQVDYWEGALRKMVETAEWRGNLEKRLWENSFTGADGSREALKLQYEEMRTGMAELGLAKN